MSDEENKVVEAMQVIKEYCKNTNCDRCVFDEVVGCGENHTFEALQAGIYSK